MKTLKDIAYVICTLLLFGIIICLGIYVPSAFLSLVFFAIFLILASINVFLGIICIIPLFLIRSAIDAPDIFTGLTAIFWAVVIFVVLAFGFPRMFK